MSTEHVSTQTLLTLNGSLTTGDVVAVARQRRPVAPISSDLERVQQSADWVAGTMTRFSTPQIVAAAETTAYYGINTGFGDNAGRAAFQRVEQAEQLSRNLLLSHSIGVGAHLPEDVVRAALLIRAASLAHGYSGVRAEVINGLIAMLNKRVYPAVPAQGSLGASGDLAPLAHLVLPLSAPLPGENVDLPGATGYCYLNGQLVTGAEAMAAADITPIRLGAKEGVALINGTAISTAIGVLALHDAERLYDWSRTALALSLEAMCGFRDAFLPHINRLRSPAQAAFAAEVLRLIEGSTLVRGDADIDLSAQEGPPQDPYSLRCAPAVMGAVAQTLAHVRMVLETESNAVTDNPLVFGDELPRVTKVISGGNFHGEPVAFVMDFLGIAVAEMANISERRVFLLTDPKLNRGLPPFLIDEPAETAGLNSGLMITQYTAASLVSENKSLAHPASVDSIPSSANREDHVSMSTTAARKAAQIIENARRVIAIELLCASQALSLRLEAMPHKHPGERTSAVLTAIRALHIAPGLSLDVIRRDTVLTPYVDALLTLMNNDE